MGDGGMGQGVIRSSGDEVSSAVLEGHLHLARQYAPTLPQLLEAGTASQKPSAWVTLTMLDALLVDALGPTVFDAIFMRHTHIAFPGLSQAFVSATKPSQLLFYFSSRYLPEHAPGVIAAAEAHGGGAKCTVSLINRRSGGMAFLRSLSCALQALLAEACRGEPEVEVHYGAESLTLTTTLPEHFGIDAGTPHPASIEAAREEIARLSRALRASYSLAGGPPPVKDDGAYDAAARTAARLRAAAMRWQLTGRQTEVLAHLLAGRSNKEIAVALHCSVATTATHVLAILRKTNMHSRQELVAHYWSEAL